MDVGEKAQAKIAAHEADIKNHKSSISALEAEVTRLRNFLTTYHELAEVEADRFETLRMADDGGAITRPDINPPCRPKGRRGPNGSPPAEVAKAAEEVIIAAGKPLTRSELIPLIEERGLTIGGNDKAKNLGTLLWRSGIFGSTGDGYWPKERALPNGRFL